MGKRTGTKSDSHNTFIDFIERYEVTNQKRKKQN